MIARIAALYRIEDAIRGRPPDERDYASFDCVGPHYFETIGTPLVRGRLIGDEDTSRPTGYVVTKTSCKACCRELTGRDEGIRV